MKEKTIQIEWSYDYRYVRRNNTQIPDESGVYNILVELQNEQLKMLYVGEGEDLNERFLYHLSESEENECIKENIKKYICWFRYALISDDDDRKDAEQALYDKYEWECNLVRPPGSGRSNKIILIEEEPGN